MTRAAQLMILLALSTATPAGAAETLVIDLEMDRDLISLAHNIDDFLFQPTLNFSTNVAGNRSAILGGETLKDHLAVTALVRIDGEVAGFATEQEVLLVDARTGAPYAESAWLITLERPGLRGVLAVTQREDPAGTFGLISEVLADPTGDWQDESQRFLSTSGETSVQHATGDLAPYRGGRFEEYNFVNPADLKNFGRFRGLIQFVIQPGPRPPE